jgi:hypothetical protein
VAGVNGRAGGKAEGGNWSAPPLAPPLSSPPCIFPGRLRGR